MHFVLMKKSVKNNYNHTLMDAAHSMNHFQLDTVKLVTFMFHYLKELNDPPVKKCRK